MPSAADVREIEASALLRGDDRRDPVAAATRIAALLPARSAEIERGRRLPADLVDAFRDAELFRLCLPRSLGGPELPLADVARVLATLGAGDASAAWCAMIASTTAALGAWLEPAAARAIFAPGAVVGGVFAPSGRARRDGERLHAAGRWSFASGCEHSTTLLGGCLVEGAARAERGVPDVRLVFFPADVVHVHDTWHVAGLAGTGSHDIEVREASVPASHAASIQHGTAREPGALYHFPVFGLLAVGVAAVGLGIARRALDEVTGLAAHKTPALGRRRLAERPVAQSRIAAAEGELGGGRALLLETVEAVTDRVAAGGEVGLAERARVRIAAAHAVAAAARATGIAYELGGGSAIYLDSPLQRCFRDVHVVTQHASVSGGSLELAGRALLGVDGDYSIL